MEKAFSFFGFFLASVNGREAWTHLGWTGYRIVMGKRTFRLEHRTIVQGIRRKNLRGTWRKVETFPIPEGTRARRAVVRKIVRIYLGTVSGVRESAGVGSHAASAVRSHAITRGNAAGGGKCRGNPTRAAAFGYSPARGREILETCAGREASNRAKYNATRGFLGASGIGK